MDKAFEWPMKCCLGVAMIYAGKKTTDYATMAMKMEKMSHGELPTGMKDFAKGLRVAKEVVVSSLQGIAPAELQGLYILKTFGSLFVTVSLGYYFFFK